MTTPTPAEPKYSDAEIDRVAKLIADKCGNGMREKYEDVARTIVESLLASRQSTPDKAGVSDADVEAACNAYNEAEAPSGNATLAGMRAALTHFASQSAEAVRVPDGWKLAMFVLQSGLYQQLPEEERAVCEALSQENPYIAMKEQSK